MTMKTPAPTNATGKQAVKLAQSEPVKRTTSPLTNSVATEASVTSEVPTSIQREATSSKVVASATNPHPSFAKNFGTLGLKDFQLLEARLKPSGIGLIVDVASDQNISIQVINYGTSTLSDLEAIIGSEEYSAYQPVVISQGDGIVINMRPITSDICTSAAHSVHPLSEDIQLLIERFSSHDMRLDPGDSENITFRIVNFGRRTLIDLERIAAGSYKACKVTVVKPEDGGFGIKVESILGKKSAPFAEGLNPIGDATSTQEAWQDPNVFGFYETLRCNTRSLTRETISKNLLPEISPGQTVLEVGSGIGELRHRLIGDGLSQGVRWIETEQNPDFLASPRFYDTEKMVAKLPSLPVGDNSIDVVCGHGVLDVLTKADLDASFQEFSRVLKPGGKVVETIDISPDLMPLVADAKERGQVPFRYFQKLESDMIARTGIFYVDKNKLEEFIQSNQALGPINRALNYHLSFPYDAIVSSNINIAMKMQECLEEAGLIVQTDSFLADGYKQKLIDAATQAGFIIEKAENHREVSLVDRDSVGDFPSRHNRLTSINGINYSWHDPELERTTPDKFKIESESLVFIARGKVD